MYQLSLKIRPNNQVTLTTGQYKNLHKEVYKTASQSKPDSLKLRRVLSTIAKKRSPIGLRSDMKSYERPVRSLPPLDITKKSQRSLEPKPRAGFGHPPKPKSFTNSSGQKLRECGAAIDHIQPDLNKTYCVTLTLPANHEQAFKTLSDYSAYCINRLFQPLRRTYGESLLWFFVWEYQRRGALHLHIAVSHDKEGIAAEASQLLISQWIKVLQDISTKSGVCMFANKSGSACTLRRFWQLDAQPMKKGLGRYFSKYAGKKESKQSWYCQKYPVSRFWGCCYALKKIIKDLSLTISVNFEDGDLMDEYCTAIIDKILKLCKIAYCEQYQFQVNLGSESAPHIIADGERTVFYVFPDMLKALKYQISQVSACF